MNYLETYCITGFYLLYFYSLFLKLLMTESINTLVLVKE